MITVFAHALIFISLMASFVINGVADHVEDAGAEPAADSAEFTFVITATTRTRDRQLILVNGLSPGPILSFVEGALVFVTVVNELNVSTSIHFHGMHQRDSQTSDGVPGVTQCPILPHSSFLYSFTAYPPGTHYYHSHYNNQMIDGLFGPLIVLPRSPSPSIFDCIIPTFILPPPSSSPSVSSSSELDPLAPLAPSPFAVSVRSCVSNSVILLVHDWYHRSAPLLLSWYRTPASQGHEPPPDSIAVNGRPSVVQDEETTESLREDEKEREREKDRESESESQHESGSGDRSGVHGVHSELEDSEEGTVKGSGKRRSRFRMTEPLHFNVSRGCTVVHLVNSAAYSMWNFTLSLTARRHDDHNHDRSPSRSRSRSRAVYNDLVGLFHIVEVDGTVIEPVTVSHFALNAGQRTVVVIDFTQLESMHFIIEKALFVIHAMTSMYPEDPTRVRPPYNTPDMPLFKPRHFVIFNMQLQDDDSAPAPASASSSSKSSPRLGPSPSRHLLSPPLLGHDFLDYELSVDAADQKNENDIDDPSRTNTNDRDAENDNDNDHDSDVIDDHDLNEFISMTQRNRVRKSTKGLQETNLIIAKPRLRIDAPKPTHFLYMEVSFSNDVFGVNRGRFNGISYLMEDKHPLLLKLMNGRQSHVKLKESDGKQIRGNERSEYLLPFGAVVDMFLNNTDDGEHPFHLHGFSFFVIDSSEMHDQYHNNRHCHRQCRHDNDDDDEANQQQDEHDGNYVRRDVFSVPAKGWVLIRFVARNPGVWAFHCHIEWHMSLGLFSTMVVAPDLLHFNLNATTSTTATSTSPLNPFLTRLGDISSFDPDEDSSSDDLCQQRYKYVRHITKTTTTNTPALVTAVSANGVKIDEEIINAGDNAAAIDVDALDAVANDSETGAVLLFLLFLSLGCCIMPNFSSLTFHHSSPSPSPSSSSSSSSSPSSSSCTLAPSDSNDDGNNGSNSTRSKSPSSVDVQVRADANLIVNELEHVRGYGSVCAERTTSSDEEAATIC